MVDNSLSDSEFLTQLEQRAFTPNDVDHVWHLRVAWVHLHAHRWPIALAKVVELLRTERELGLHPLPYHHTLTVASLRIVNVRIGQADYDNFFEFLEHNPDLADDFDTVISRYYSHETFYSEAAKTSYVPPDLRPLD